MGWLFTLDTDKRDFSNVEDLMQDPMLRFQHRFFIPVAIFVGYLLPIAIASLWGDFWGGLFIAGALRIALMQQFTFCINSICHMFGKRNFSDKSSARDNWVTALLTFGEGYHNFHHKFPLDYRNGIRFYHFDPAKWLISSLEVVGLVSDVKRVKEHRIIKSRLSMDQKKLETIKNKYGELADNVNKAMQPVYESVQQVLNRMEELETVYKELKASRVELMRGRANEYKKRAREYRQQINESKKELKRLMKEWTNLMDNYPLAT